MTSPTRLHLEGLKRSILATLNYSDHFHYPLTRKELLARLISPVLYSPREVATAIASMLKRKLIQSTGGYLHLYGKSSVVAMRKSRKANSQPLLTKAKLTADKLGKFPGITAIYLTGSLAMSNIDRDSDIDLMIITKSGRLWSTRLLLTLFTTAARLRRTPGSTSHAGKLCLNLYLTPESYLLPPHKRSLYTAYELIQAVPLYDPHNTRSDLLSANSWISDFLPNQSAGPGPAGLSKPPAVPGPIGTLLESLSYHLQLAYMKPKLTREYITKNSAFFHPHDPSPPFTKV